VVVNVAAVLRPVTIETPADMRSWSRAARGSGRSIALVPTMGALHDGHLTLIEHARSRADVVVVSIFVNPLQFGEHGDFTSYPRPIDTDLAACERAQVAAVYAPTAAAMYPHGFETRVVPGRLAATMEGHSRPGHFEGVTTVVAKLLAAVGPDLAVFGEKDYQQLAIIRRMVSDLDLGVDVVATPTVREPDGLALSSRNQRLTPSQRRAAVCIPRSIAEARDVAARPDATLDAVLARARRVIDDEPQASLDYVNVFDAATLEAIDDLDDTERLAGRCRIAIAARFGDVRLIDNADLYDG